MSRVIIIFGMMISIFCMSCSRQLTDITHSSQLWLVSSTPVRQNKCTAGFGEIHAKNNSRLATAMLAIKPCDPISKHGNTYKINITRINIKSQPIKSGVSKYLAKVTNSTDLSFSEKHTLASYSRINKAGFILIGAAILGYFLHLILAACIIIMILGLVILLAPLFRRRY